MKGNLHGFPLQTMGLIIPIGGIMPEESVEENRKNRYKLQMQRPDQPELLHKIRKKKQQG